MAWQLYECTILDLPALVLIDNRFAGTAPLEELPLLTWVGVYNRLPHGEGLWDPDETDDLEALEAELLLRFEARGQGWAVYVLRIVTPGVREYYVYHSGQARVGRAVQDIHKTWPRYRIETSTIQDPLWVQYRKYVSPISGAGDGKSFE